MKILMTGGSGILGREMLKLESHLIAPAHGQLDITQPASIKEAILFHCPDAVLHLAADTKTAEHQTHPQNGLQVNIIGTANIALACLEKKIRLVYTSTDYLYQGQGPHKEEEPVRAPYHFAWSKLGGEAAVAMCPGSLILRLSFGPAPFPWENVYEGQLNSKLYVDEIAPLVLGAVQSTVCGILNIGGPRTTLEAHAKRTRPDIQTIPCPPWVPKDTSLDIVKMKQALGILDENKLLKH